MLGFIVEIDDHINLWDNTMKVREIGLTWYQGLGIVLNLWHKRITFRRR